eukprot:CAMPEP_0179023410 /NCGR_PEP_ID=MMETSP0796-20121207/6913_1 /TAXON_ID=73915 /ORGANISM="Pyrodinium bahamense, Strain pbaha01" /LENGTH=284 /DNA_ID=CAMNT_0020719315 /DNA_START=42 /DNA_END=897 /DNA_ORIENTATION=-
MPNTTYCKVWATTEEVSPLPSEPFLTAYMVVLALSALVVGVAVRNLRPKEMRRLLREAGVAIHKVAKTAREIERKIFHLCGLLVPLIYQVLLQYWFSQTDCARICWAITVVGGHAAAPCAVRPAKLAAPGILRDKEIDQLCGGSYFALGCTLSIHFFAPVIAMTSIIFLVLGDMSAALIGRSFGQSVCSMKIGPGGKKSVEGSAAMFLVCFIFGCTIFSQVHLREYSVFFAALTATLTELYEPFSINDNVSVPLLSSLALTLGFARTYSCEPTQNPLLWYAKHN